MKNFYPQYIFIVLLNRWLLSTTCVHKLLPPLKQPINTPNPQNQAYNINSQAAELKHQCRNILVSAEILRQPSLADRARARAVPLREGARRPGVESHQVRDEEPHRRADGGRAARGRLPEARARGAPQRRRGIQRRLDRQRGRPHRAEPEPRPRPQHRRRVRHADGRGGGGGVQRHLARANQEVSLAFFLRLMILNEF